MDGKPDFWKYPFNLQVTHMTKGRWLIFMLLFCSQAIRANNLLVQNVTTLGNNAGNKTIQVQFDISWDNSWRDSVNWDAVWIFMKFKNAAGLWQHVQLNTSGVVKGSGTAGNVQVTSDKVGAWLYRSDLGTDTFNVTGMQLQWNYGLNGLTDVAGLEVRVFAVEMVYVPEGDFNAPPMTSWQELNFFNLSNSSFSTNLSSFESFPSFFIEALFPFYL
jgi:hypothetical protein